jgi:hypothetical protein
VRSTIRVAGLVGLTIVVLSTSGSGQHADARHISVLALTHAAGPSSPSDRLTHAQSPAAQSPAAQSPAAQSPAAQSPAAQSPTAQSPSTPKRSRTARRYPIRDSIDRAVEAVLLAHEKPCEWARMMNVPCFPVDVEQEGPHFSVAESLRLYRGTGAPAPGVPTVAETQHQLSGAPLSASGGVGFDPVCTTKNLVKKLSGKNTRFHLYRMWDAQGERPLLTDRVLDLKSYAPSPDVQYEYMGEFDGECQAVAAWRKALRKATEDKPLPDDWDEIKEPPPP